MPISQTQIDALKALNAQEATLLGTLVADVSGPPQQTQPPSPAVNPYIDRAHPKLPDGSSMVSHYKGTACRWDVLGADIGGLTKFMCNGAPTVSVMGLRLVLQNDNAYAKQADGSWLLGTLYGGATTKDVVMDPVA